MSPVVLGSGRPLWSGLARSARLELLEAKPYSIGQPHAPLRALWLGGERREDERQALELDEHLFRRESGRLVAALTRIFGVHNLALAEDVVQDAFCRALEVWKVRGVPDNPSAWLMATAKNRALDVVRRERTARTFAPEMGRLLETEWTLAPVVDEAFARAHDPRRAAADDVLVLPSATAGGGAGRARSSTSCAASARTRSRARS